MKKLRNLIALLAVFSMAAVFTGCGDDDDGDDNNNQNQGPQFAPANVQAFRGNTYTVTFANGQTGQLTFPSDSSYSLTLNGVTETGTITGLALSGEDYIATLSPQNADGTIRAGEMRARFTQKTATSYTGTLTVQTADGAQTYPFTATVNTGGTTQGGTTQGGTTQGGTTQGGTTDGGTTQGGTTQGGTTQGGTTDGGTTQGGTTQGGTTQGGTGEIPDSLVGKRLQLTYGTFGELFTFTSATAGTYEQGQETITYTWDRQDTRVLATRNGAGGALVANYDIDLTFNQGSGSAGTAVIKYIEPNGSTTTDPATFTLQ